MKILEVINVKLKELVPTGWVIQEDSGSMRLWYSSNRGNYNRKAFTFPQEIIVDTSFAELMGLILGDGDMHRKEKCHFTFASKDPEISAFVLNALRKKLSLKNKDITLTTQYRYINPEVFKLAKLLNVNTNSITTRFSLRHNYPTLQIQVNGVVFRLVLERIVNSFIKSNFLEEINLRRGFLRGLFAAEGCVGIKHREKYINQIEFTLSIKEIELFDLLLKALTLEEIRFKVIRNAEHNYVQAVIQNWQNYLKCWKIGLFDRCERKKKAFLDVAQSSLVYAKVTSEDLQQLSERYTQRKLAEIIGSWQGNVCRILRGEIWLSLEQIKTLEELEFGFSIQRLRVGNLTELSYNEDTKRLFL